MSYRRYFERRQDREESNHPFHWSVKDKVIPVYPEIHVWVERNEYRGPGKWAVKMQKMSPSDGWTNGADVVGTNARKRQAKKMAMEWVRNYASSISADADEVDEMVRDGWEVIEEISGFEISSDDRLVRMVKDMTRKDLIVSKDDYLRLVEEVEA